MERRRRNFTGRLIAGAGVVATGIGAVRRAEAVTKKIPRVVQAYVDTFAAGGLTTGGLDKWYTLVTEDSTYGDPDFPKPVLLSSLKGHWKEAFAAFPDATYEAVSLDAISERAWVYRWVMHATHTGPLLGFEDLPPTGRRFTMPGCDFVELRGDLISSDVGYFDRFTLLSQLGFTLSKPHAPANQPATAPHS